MARPSMRPEESAGRPPVPASWVKRKPCPSALWLLHQEQGQAAVGLGPVGIGAGQQHEDVGPGGERAPGLHPVDEPAPFGAGRCGDHPGHVGAEVGLGDRHRSHRLGRGQLGQPLLLLLLGASVDQGTGQDLGPGDQRAAGPQRAPRELLGGHHHAQVVGLAPGGEPAVLLGDRHAEAPHLGHARDDLLGDVGVGPVDVLGPGSDLLLGETVEGLPNQLEVGVEVAIARLVRPTRPGRRDPGRRPRTPRPGPSSRRPRPTGRPARWCGWPGRPRRRRRRRRPAGPRRRRGSRSRGRPPPVRTAAAAWATS